MNRNGSRIEIDHLTATALCGLARQRRACRADRNCFECFVCSGAFEQTTRKRRLLCAASPPLRTHSITIRRFLVGAAPGEGNLNRAQNNNRLRDNTDRCARARLGADSMAHSPPHTSRSRMQCAVNSCINSFGAIRRFIYCHLISSDVIIKRYDLLC